MEIFNLGVPNMAERHPKIKYTQIRFKSRKNINNKGNKKSSLKYPYVKT